MGIDLKQIPGLGSVPGAVTAAPKQAQAPTGPAAAGGTPAGAEPQGFGLANIKKFGFLGPLGFEIGVAKDKNATESDVIAEMRFIGGDWRVTGVRPGRL